MPSDRDGAALLAAASAEDLERDADVMEALAMTEQMSTMVARDNLRRLAALARAVAQVERGGDWDVLQRTGRHTHTGFWLKVHIPVSDEHFTPTAALASLLVGAR